MQFRVFAAISCMVALAMVNTADSQLTAVSLAVVVIAGLAIAKEKLIAAEIHRQYIRRPVHEEYEAPSSGYGHKRVAKREAAEASFEPMFESAALLDTDDCAKMLICQSFEKPEEQLNTFEQKINKLFANDFQKIDAQSQKADFQLAAYVGSLRQPGLCQQRYAKCLVSPDVLSDVRL